MNYEDVHDSVVYRANYWWQPNYLRRWHWSMRHLFGELITHQLDGALYSHYENQDGQEDPMTLKYANMLFKEENKGCKSNVHAISKCASYF